MNKNLIREALEGAERQMGECAKMFRDDEEFMEIYASLPDAIAELKKSDKAWDSIEGNISIGQAKENWGSTEEATDCIPSIVQNNSTLVDLCAKRHCEYCAKDDGIICSEGNHCQEYNKVFNNSEEGF